MAQSNVIPLLYIALTCIMFSKANTFSLPMIPIDSPHLQIFPQGFALQQRHELLMNITMARASLHSIKKESKSNSSASVNSFESSVEWKPSNFYVTQVFLGTSNELMSAYLLLDTGSTTTWVQCEGCNPCIPCKYQNIAISKSITYKLLRIDDDRCEPKLYYGEYCGYQKTYGNGAITTGRIGSDTFIFLNLDTKQPEFFKDLVFGCGLENDKFDFGLNTGPDNPILGIFGLAPGPQSFLNQLDATIKGRFAYCLPSWSNIADIRLSTMQIGDSAQIGDGSDVRTIKMSPEARYHLYFRGISVDGRRLNNVGTSTCPLDKVAQKGFIIDSGAPSSLLPQSAYQVLRDAVVAFFDRYGWKKVTGQMYDLCYVLGRNYSPTDFGGPPFPKIVFHFENGDGSGSEVDWVMENENMFVRFDEIRGFCMVVHKIPDEAKICIFGAYQQSNYKILYDAKNFKLSFKPKRCIEY